MITLNPVTQIKKSQDSQRRSDIHQIRNALEAYYHDHNCYPLNSISLPWGQEWKENNMTYMKKVPVGPSCSGRSCSEYTYITDATNCPQWYSVFAKKDLKDAGSSDCPLESLSNCTPNGYLNSYYICASGGITNCSTIASSSLQTNPLAVSPTPTPTPVQVSNPCVSGDPNYAYYGCSISGACNELSPDQCSGKNCFCKLRGSCGGPGNDCCDNTCPQ